MKTIAVDFDGVIHRYSAGWHDGTCYDIPVEGAIPALEKLMKHYAVVVISTRDPAQIQEWFQRKWPEQPTRQPGTQERFFNGEKKDGRAVLGITDRKGAAIAYIDDRAIRFINWKDAESYFV